MRRGYSGMDAAGDNGMSIGGPAVTDERAAGTSGGGGVTSGAGPARRRRALWLALVFLAMFAVQGYANLTSMQADLARDGIVVAAWKVRTWEATSLVVWLVLTVPIWWWVRIVRPPRQGWPVLVAGYVAASVVISLVHIGGMVALRMLVYRLVGEHYSHDPWPAVIGYEYRKDLATFLLFALLAAGAQWLLDGAEPPPPVWEPPRVLAVQDGAVTHQLPVDEIDALTAAGNYVEVAWRDRMLLHRATLAAVEAELGGAFVRIHRSRLVRRAAIRRVATERSGDFSVELASGATLRGSRRYRSGL